MGRWTKRRMAGKLGGADAHAPAQTFGELCIDVMSKCGARAFIRCDPHKSAESLDIRLEGA